MEAQGADPDAVARLRAQLEDDDEDDDEEPDAPAADVDDGPPELWPENEEGFRVFTHCKWDREIVAGLDRTLTVYTGIASSEVESVCNLLGVPLERRTDVLHQVRIAESAAAPLLNARD